MQRFLPFLLLALPLSILVAGESDSKTKKILMLAGRPSHGYGAHEHYAGLKILEETITEATDGCEVTVVRGWPSDPALIDQADSIVIYCDGGGRHLAIPHLAELREKLKQGCGLVCLHYAVEMVPGEAGDAWVELLGGHFEIHYSVNPHWVAPFAKLPDHPITHGVEPFSANDEWYFHLRFNQDGNVFPVLAAVAPEDTMRRKDGAHSGNPTVRKSVAAGDPQTLAWAYSRPDGGRSFGFTGGHFHWNWGSQSYRRLVSNAIRWTAGDEVEPEGSSLDAFPSEQLLENQDFEPPKTFDFEATKQQYHLSIVDPHAWGPFFQSIAALTRKP
ncbi:ThuA domain-containing protein [Novipirellula artificiosorum]|uniref:ThuA domain-containing protein n=1 Tax=Novipirellula artificiosorum TaxID=2528016 RepID=UPI001E428125|nr:ThuA domain-containing protein [Novipirellula artificiosorum]